MNQQHILRICDHYNINEQDITKLSEWEYVFHVVIKGIGSRLISKAVVHSQGDKNLFALFRSASPKSWCLYNLKFLSRIQLRSLSMLLGIESNGTKDVLTKRIKNSVEVMTVLAPYVKEIYQFRKYYQAVDPDDLTIPLTTQSIDKRFIREHKHTELKALSIQAGLSCDRPGLAKETKQQLSHKLFCWFDNCLIRKQQEFKAAIAILNGRKKLLSGMS